jgi:hypothetical protein
MGTCTQCALQTPDFAVMCDCGHPFDTPGADAALGGFRPSNRFTLKPMKL